MKLMDVVDPLQMRKGGLLWKPIKQATGLTDAQMIGIGALAAGGAIAAPALIGGAGAAGATGAAAGATGAAEGGALTLGGGVPNFAAEMAATAPESGGIFATLGKAGTAVSGGLGAANAVNGMMKSPQMQASPMPQHQAPDLTGLLNMQNQQQAAMSQEQLARKQQQQQVINGLLNGGLYGRTA